METLLVWELVMIRNKLFCVMKCHQNWYYLYSRSEWHTNKNIDKIFIECWFNNRFDSQVLGFYDKKHLSRLPVRPYSKNLEDLNNLVELLHKWNDKIYTINYK